MNDAQVVAATSCTFVLLYMSGLVIVSGNVLLLLWRRHSGKSYWAWFVLVMFLAVLLFDLGVWGLENWPDSLLLSVFHTLQTMTGNRDLELPYFHGATDEQTRFVSLYATFLYIVAPISIVSAAVAYFSSFFTRLRVRAKSLFVDSYVFSRLDKRTLDLAMDIEGHYRQILGFFGKPICIVFAGCDGVDEDLLVAARRLGAACLKDDVTRASRLCWRYTSGAFGAKEDWKKDRGIKESLEGIACSIILLEEDEEAAIVTARSIKEEAQDRCPLFGGGETHIFVLTDFRHTESLLFPESLSEEQQQDKSSNRGKVLLRGIDLTRELVEQVLISYPVFLPSKPPAGSVLSGGTDAVRFVDESASHAGWYCANAAAIDEARFNELYTRPDRHVLVVGAGSIGTEFLSSVLWASRIDGVHTRIDVVDAERDPLHPNRPMAESRYAAEAPGIMQNTTASSVNRGSGEQLYDLAFELLDAETDDYARFLERRARTLSYVFIALGDDLLNSRVAMRTRQVLDRQRANNADSREAFLCASRPLIVTVVRDDEFSDTVENAMNEGQPYDIVCVGNNSDVLTYKMLGDMIGNRRTEYKRRSSRAGDTHAKYRLYSFGRNLFLNKQCDASGQGIRQAFRGVLDDSMTNALCQKFNIESNSPAIARVRAAFGGQLSDDMAREFLEEIDWSIDIKDSNEMDRVGSWPLALLFQLYCTDGITCALDSGRSKMSSPMQSREWLLRMEHDRWNAYVRTQGMVTAGLEVSRAIFATGQEEAERHRSNLMGLHPCLVPYGQLGQLELPIFELYDDYYREMEQRGMSVPRNNKVIGGAGEMVESWARLLDDKYIGI